MSLSDRLAAAAAARGQRLPNTVVREQPAAEPDLAPGPLLTRTAPAPTPRPNPATPPAPAGKRIIAPASTVADIVEPDPDAEPESICPTCGRTGEIAMVDLPGRTIDWACGACTTLWQVRVTAAPAPARTD